MFSSALYIIINFVGLIIFRWLEFPNFFSSFLRRIFITVFYANNHLPSFQIPFPFIPLNFSPWFITGRTFSAKREVFVYTSSGNSFHYSRPRALLRNVPEGAKTLKALRSKSIGVSRASIRRAIQKNAKPNLINMRPMAFFLY